MEFIKCQIKGCENNAFMIYAGRMICGDCFMKIRQKELDRINKDMEELEKENDKVLSTL
jgi:hypothetical protein